MYELPETGFLRLSQIIGQEEVTEQQAAENRRLGKGPMRRRPGKPPIVPVKKSCWYEGVKIGRFPAPIKVGSGRGTFYRIEDIRALIESTKA